MIPIGDSIRSRTFPYVNIAIIVVNFLVFFYELSLGTIPSFFPPVRFEHLAELDRFFFRWGTLPGCLSDVAGFDPNLRPGALETLCPSEERTLITPFTSMFIHAGWLHILGNMVFLWVFGDNVEDAMGHARYLAFYLLAGLGAIAAHIAATQAFAPGDLLVPSVGASGAIAGVMAAYLVLFPRATVTVLIPLFFFWAAYVPAVLLIGVWFLMQVFSGIGSIGGDVVGGTGGVAWFAHIGGFVFGVALVGLFRRRRPPPIRPVEWPRRSWWR